MAVIAATDVTYAITKQRKEDSSNKVYNMNISFGDGALTYPAGGIPLTAGKMGAPNSIISVILVDPASANGFVYKYDLANNKMRIYQGDSDGVADGPLVELGGAATPAATTLNVEVTGY